MELDPTSTPRAVVGLQLRKRPANAATLSPSELAGAMLTSPTMDLMSDGSSTMVRQNGRNVLAFSSASAGLTTTWGPLAPSLPDNVASMVNVARHRSVNMFLRCDGTVNDYGAYVGLGTQTLLRSTSVGVTITLPSGGSVPLAATTAGGGPIGGVIAGVPWDMVFFNQWRSLVISNDAATNARRVFVDGWEITGAQSVASTVAIPANTPVTVFPGATLRLSELIVWNDTIFSSTQVMQLKDAQKIKWNVVEPTTSTGGTTTTIGVTSTADPATIFKASLALTVSVSLDLPLMVPRPTGCWLDASDVDSIRSDEFGVANAVPNGRVRVWRDRSGSGRHCSFPLASQAMWTTRATDLTSTGLPLVLIGAGPGTFIETPLASTFTVVAVWRLNAQPGVVGGHPCGAGTGASFSSTMWKETLGMDASRVMTTPTDPTGELKYMHGDMVLAMWERNETGTVTWRVRGLLGTGNSGAVQWSTSAAAGESAWLMRPVQVNATGTYLALCELIVWRTVLSDMVRGVLQAHLQAKWGLTIGTTPVVSKVIPNPGSQLGDVPELLLIDPADTDSVLDVNGNPITVSNTFIRRIYVHGGRLFEHTIPWHYHIEVDYKRSPRGPEIRNPWSEVAGKRSQWSSGHRVHPNLYGLVEQKPVRNVHYSPVWGDVPVCRRHQGRLRVIL